MRAPLALGAFVLALTAVFGGAAALGSAVDPLVDEPQTSHGVHEDTGHGELPQGLSVARDGYALQLEQQALPLGVASTLSFRIAGATTYVPTHERELHLVVVRRDGTGFQHLHPTRDATGLWSTTLTLPTTGSWKAFADFRPTGADEAIALGVDLVVPGELAPSPPPAPTRTAEVDGYAVTLAGDLVAGEESALTLSVTRDGVPVRTDPYLGARGHLVALRVGDLAYLHAHPGGDDLSFGVEAPTPGSYHLYLDFLHDGVVRTAAFSASAS